MARPAQSLRHSHLTDAAGRLVEGYIHLYSGTIPANADTAIDGGNTLLAEFRFGDPAFGSPSAGVITANAITPEDSAPASGTPTFARLLESDGTTPVMDVTAAGVGGSAELVLTTPSVVEGAEVNVQSLTITYPAVPS